MKNFNYKQVGKEIGWNFSKINPTIEYTNHYNYYKKVMEHITPTTIMLDIGCGSAEKAIRYYSLAKKIYETDLEPEMLKKAKLNAEKYYKNDDKTKNKFIFKIMNSFEPFYFKDNNFDLVISRHCGANMKEVYRVLKNDGIFVSEDYSFNDCQELKDFFKRGQNYNQSPLYKKIFNDCTDVGFSEINFLRFEEIEYYKKEELIYLLQHTPILNGFDENKDLEILNQYISKFSSPKGIKLTRRLYAFELKK